MRSTRGIGLLTICVELHSSTQMNVVQLTVSNQNIDCCNYDAWAGLIEAAGVRNRFGYIDDELVSRTTMTTRSKQMFK